MNRRSKNIRPRPVPPAYRRAFERLDAALEEYTRSDHYEKIQSPRQAEFADVDRLEAFGPVKIPDEQTD